MAGTRSATGCREILTFLRYNNYGLDVHPVQWAYDYCRVRDENGLEVWMKTECLEPVVEDKVLFDWTSKDGRLHCSKTRLANGKTMLVTGRGNHEGHARGPHHGAPGGQAPDSVSRDYPVRRAREA